MKPAAFALGLILLALPLAPRADEDLVAKREVCRQEARARIGLKEKIDVDGYRRIVELRSAHISQCMTRAVMHVDPPLPPQRAPKVPNGKLPNIQAASIGKGLHKVMKRINRKKLQRASTKTAKGQRLKRKAAQRLLRRNR